ncbi:hypothetical protein SDC9_46815 [bioreactor metagenome]|uniref:Phosphoadenosine phosphosulphate reductase domain-containing protein n=1 Tax=bioreactor metagenome TaxID=1076179 RepID=A0A644WAP8_9ZZZZ
MLNDFTGEILKYVVCYSGGHSSALVAVEAVRKYGKENVILLNHNISSIVEHADIKRFKEEVADYLGVEITYANMDNFEDMPPLKVAVELSGFQFAPGQALCTYNLKTKPFYKWLKDNYPATPEHLNQEITILYGFDMNEKHRIIRRSGLLGAKGYYTDFPLALWDRTIQNIEEIGIERPITYDIFKHANCIGCLKAGRQHWYVVYCLYPELFKEAVEAESFIGHSIIKGIYLDEIEPKFAQMKERGVVPTDKTGSATFWASVRKELKEEDSMPCECAI